MGIAKKIDSMAYAIAQGMTQGALPLIGYNYASKSKERFKEIIKTVFTFSLVIAVTGMICLLVFAVPISRYFIEDTETVRHGVKFLKIISLACPTTSLNFMIVTIFQATGASRRPLILSFLRKGGLDVPLMFIFDRIGGVDTIAWATPGADVLALIVALIMLIPYIKEVTENV